MHATTSELLVDIIFPVIERILLISWLLKDCGWLLLVVYVAIPFGFVSVTIHFLLLFCDPRPSFRFYNYSLFVWVFGNFIWMNIEFVYGTPSTNIHFGPTIPLGGLPDSYENGLTETKSWFFFAGILIQLFMYLGIYFGKIQMARDDDEDPTIRNELHFLLGIRPEVILLSNSFDVRDTGSPTRAGGEGAGARDEIVLNPAFLSAPSMSPRALDEVENGGYTSPKKRFNRLNSHAEEDEEDDLSPRLNNGGALKRSQSSPAINRYTSKSMELVRRESLLLSSPPSSSSTSISPRRNGVHVGGAGPGPEAGAAVLLTVPDSSLAGISSTAASATASAATTRPSSRGPSLVFVENFYITFWIMKDFFWSWGTGDFTRGLESAVFFESTALFFGMVSFCVYLITAYIYRSNMIRLADCITTMFWIAANFVWMSGEFFIRYRNLQLDDTDQGQDRSTRIVAALLFGTGIVIQLFVLLHVGIKNCCRLSLLRQRRRNSKKGLQIVQLYDLDAAGVGSSGSPIGMNGDRGGGDSAVNGVNRVNSIDSRTGSADSGDHNNDHEINGNAGVVRRNNHNMIMNTAITQPYVLHTENFVRDPQMDTIYLHSNDSLDDHHNNERKSSKNGINGSNGAGSVSVSYSPLQAL